VDAMEATAIYGRAGVAGAVGGGLLGPAMGLVVVPLPASSGVWDAVRAMLFLSPWAVAAGVVIGGLVGGVNGLVLSHREMLRPRTGLDQRVTAFLTSVAVVVAFTWFLWCTATAVIALTGGVAGAALAPTVVRGL
jgi:hypothetical protein